MKKKGSQADIEHTMAKNEDFMIFSITASPKMGK